MKKQLSSLFSKIPFKRQILKAGAKLPPVLKIPLVKKALTILYVREGASLGEFVTNFGINSHWRIKTSSSTNLLFGRPSEDPVERGALFLCKALQSDCKAFVDIGANRGYFSLFVYSVSGGKLPVYFFEPNPVLFKLLQENLKSNEIKNVFGFQKAMGRSLGQRTFFIDETDDSSSTLNESFAEAHQHQPISVDATSFDLFASENGLTDLLCKVDIEGAEEEFLAGAIDGASRIKYLVMEILGEALKAGFVKKAKQALGAEAYVIHDFELHHSPDGTHPNVEERVPMINWLFCRLSPTELALRLRDSKFRVIKRAKQQSTDRGGISPAYGRNLSS